jgi:hypothetical protein
MVSINIYNTMMNPNRNKKNLTLPPLNSFPTFNNEEQVENEFSSDRIINSNISTIKMKNSSMASKNKSKNEKSESEKERENISDYTPSFSQEYDLSGMDYCENSFKLQN